MTEQAEYLIDKGEAELSTAEELINSELAKEYTLLAEGDDWHKVGSGIFHASKVTGCMRRKYFVYRKKEELGVRGLNPQTARYFKRGKLFDEWLTNSEHFLGRHIRIEIPINDFIIRCEVDAVSQNFVWEFKTYAKKGRYLPSRVENQTPNQVTGYMRALHKDQAKVCYIRPDDLQSKTFTVRFDPCRWENVVARIAVLHEYLKIGTPPPPTKSCPMPMVSFS